MIELLEGKFFKTFIAVMEEKNFSRAADRLGYVQSTVTSHIQLLEQACGQRLFHRLSRGVKPTLAGLKLSKYAYQFIHLGSTLEEAMNELDQPQGTVRIRMQESFFLTRTSLLIRDFIKEYPKIRLQLENGFQHDIVQQVQNHAVDFGIVPQNPNRPDILFTPLLEEKLVFIASNDLAEKVESESLGALSRETFISFGTSCVYHTKAGRLLQDAGIEGNSALEYPSIAMIKEAVKCGIGFAFIPEIAVKQELEAKQFKLLPVTAPIVSTHGLIVHQDRELSLAASLLKEKLIGYFCNDAEKSPTN
ncbi:LysR family transcriptional regulator [Bacillus paralicheniformis]|uniref:LysR family transcriptional regulator n=1 Tax=Bacillus paralicheniformis TaxID=1648923 RepID=UPI00227F16DF|nr:LysR family transcriptional regulator [Bacillus paralicheniformis]MCY8151083.1 LysR family transcriptional regulator [Bacillus paralicheniformis]MCY9422544.1 LysR family transcriptional regulator [Bacillus paralicheniformis]MEC0578593.1 LysR family transcriptional regulator [Bacillus paralicheniformis]